MVVIEVHAYAVTPDLADAPASNVRDAVSVMNAVTDAVAVKNLLSPETATATE